MLLFPLTQPTENGPALCEPLNVFLSDHSTRFEDELTPDLSYIDAMAHKVGGIKIVAVRHLADNRYQMEYMFTWELFLGCSNIQQCGTGRERVRFSLGADGEIDIEFPQVLQRDTGDEL